MSKVRTNIRLLWFTAITMIAAFVWFTVRTAYGQLPTGTILGVVRDSSDSLIPGANVVARNTDTGQTRTTVTGVQGAFRLSALPVGQYEVRVEHSGFQSAVQSGLTLTVSQEAVLNFTMQVGRVEETVSVTAEAPLVNTTSGSLGGLVSEERVAELPLEGRSFMGLTLLQPGITQHRNATKTVPGTAGVRLSSSGAPFRSNNYLMDGAIMQNLIVSTAASASGASLGLEGIREFRIISNSFGAEYGMTMGSQIVMVSKSGTNTLHGSLFEYLRNSALDARNFFDYKTEAAKRRSPPFVRNNFGGSIGGPIRKDATFFFLTYEGLRERLGVTKISPVPGVGCRGGAGAVVTREACPQLPEIVGQPASAQVATVSPVIAPWIAIFPQPNLSGNRYTFPFTQPTNELFAQGRGDHSFSDSDSFFGRYTINDSQQNQVLDTPDFTQSLVSRNQFATVSENHVLSPTAINTARLSYSRTFSENQSPSRFTGPQYSFIPGKAMGVVNIAGIGTYGPSSTTPAIYNQGIFTFSDDMFSTLGKHSLKYGVLINHFRQYVTVSTDNRGTVQFANVRDFLEGRAQSYTAITPGSQLSRTHYYTTYGFYLQDDYQVRPNLTVNLGLRYEFNTDPSEVRGRGAALRDIVNDTKTTLGLPVQNDSKRNIGPRLGFAWNATGDGKTSVRGGFGMLYDIGLLGATLVVTVTSTPPFSSSSTVAGFPVINSLPLAYDRATIGNTIRGADYNIKQPYMFHYNLTIDRQLPWNSALSLGYVGSKGTNIITEIEGNPSVPDIQPSGRMFWPSVRRRNPAWGPMLLGASGINSHYHSLQFGLKKEAGHGLVFQNSYTWSKSIDETQGQLGGDITTESVVAMDPYNRKTDRGRSAFDIEHNWRLNTLYSLPGISKGGVAKAVLNGWRVGSIVSLQSGYPFTINILANRSRNGVQTGQRDRPDLVVGRTGGNVVTGTTAGCAGVAAGQKLGTPELYYDPCAFTLADPGFLGTAGRNFISGPGLATVDLSFSKDNVIHRLGESGRMEFRAEIFNILNRVNFDSPDRILYSGSLPTESPLRTAGRITGAGTARQIQFALKLLF